MSWDVVVRAHVKFPKGGLAKWKSAAPAFLKDAPTSFPKATGKLPKTVAKILAALPDVTTYLETNTKSDQWTLAALLSEDDYLDFGPVLAAVASAAAADGGEGELLYYGFDTAPAGIAYRIGVKGGAVAFAKLSSAEEKKLASSREGARFTAYVESCVKKEQDALMPKSAAAFYKGMEGVKPLVAEALAFIQKADDKALVAAVQKKRLYSFYPADYKTGKAIKAACRPDGKKLDYPEMAMGDVLRLVDRLDPEKALSLARRIAESKVVPGLFWDACAEILAPSPLAPIFVKHFWRVRADGSWINPGKNELMEWGEFLGGSKLVTNELLLGRLRYALTQAAKSKGDARDGAGQVATYLAAALLLHRKQWKLVPEVAKATFGHVDLKLRLTLHNVLAELPPEVPVPAPRLDGVEREGIFPQLYGELERRLARDPKQAYEELHALLESGDYAARAAAFGVLRNMAKPARAVVDAKEPRWKAWAKKHPGA